jgi:hypothetical protein
MIIVSSLSIVHGLLEVEGALEGTNKGNVRKMEKISHL